MKQSHNLRQYKVLQLLISSDKPIPSKRLAEITGVTARTIKSDIDLINDELKKYDAVIIASYGSGYELQIKNEAAFKAFVSDRFNQNQSVVSDEPSLRIKELIRFLLTVDDYIKLEDLAESMYISKSTLQNDLREAKELLRAFQINVDVKPYHGIKLVGSEMKFRFAISEFLFAHDQDNSIYMDKIAIPIPDKELAIIRRVVIRHAEGRNVEFSDMGLDNLVIHIAIAYQRVVLGHQITHLPEDINKNQNEEEYEVAEQIVKELSGILEINLPHSETAYIAMHLMGTKMFASAGNGKEIHDKITEPSVYQYTLDIVNALDAKLGINLIDDKDLIKGLYLHLKPAINRIRYGMSLRNPLLDSIKIRLPLAFQASVFASTVLKEKSGYQFSDNEIGYIAMHIGAAIERNKQMKPPKKCIVVCGSGLGSAQLLLHKLRAHFGDRLQMETMGYYKLKESSLVNVDFIISTIPIQISLPVPVIMVDTLLGATDLVNVEQVIIGGIEPNLAFVRRDLTFLMEEFESSEDLVRFLCHQLKEQGYVADDIYELVRQREEVTSTAYGNLVAIPHPIIPQTEKTVWVICTLRKPIDWAGKPVQFVCLLCIAKDGRAGDLSSMYNLLVKMVDDVSLVQQLTKCRDFDSFHKILKSNL